LLDHKVLLELQELLVVKVAQGQQESLETMVQQERQVLLDHKVAQVQRESDQLVQQGLLVQRDCKAHRERHQRKARLEARVSKDQLAQQG
jgi:hypothetical protein